MQYTKWRIKQIRKDKHMTQSELAEYLCVSKKTVESWEYGNRHPSGPACKLLYLLEIGQENFDEKKPHFMDGKSFYYDEKKLS